MKIRAFVMLALISASALAVAQSDEPIQSNCLFVDRECIGKERIQRRREAQARENAIRMESARQYSIAQEEERTAKKEEEQRRSDLKYEQYLAERERKKAEMEKEREDDERAERQAKKRRDVETADLKTRCGSDYKTPSIGMRIERVQECVAPAKLVSQINRADGVVSTYRSGSFSFHVMSGRVMAWDRY